MSAATRVLVLMVALIGATGPCGASEEQVQVTLHLGAGANLVGLPVPFDTSEPLYTASDLARDTGASFVGRGYEADYGRNRTFLYFPGTGGFDFPIRPGSGLIVSVPSERVVTLTMPLPRSGTITTVAGNGVAGFSGDGGPALEARLNAPVDIAFDSGGNLYIGEYWNARVRRVDAKTGFIETVAGTNERDEYGNAIRTGDGGPATEAGLDDVDRIAIDDQDVLYIQGRAHLRQVDLGTGIIDTALELPFWPQTAVRDDGSIFYSSEQTGDGSDLVLEGYLYRLGPGGEEQKLLMWVGAQIMSSGPRRLIFNTEMYDTIRSFDLLTGEVESLLGVDQQNWSVDGLPGTVTALARPSLAIEDKDANLIICEPERNLVRRWNRKTGAVTTLAGDGYLDWFRDRGTWGRWSGDGGPAFEASLNGPIAARFGPDGALYVADTGNHVIRRISMEPASPTTRPVIVTRMSPGLNFLSVPPVLGNTQAVRASYIASQTGSRFVATTEVRDGRSVFRSYLPSLPETDFDLGPLQAALVSVPIFKSVDFSHRGRVGFGTILTVVGDGAFDFHGDGGPPTAAGISLPEDVCFDNQGRLLISDTWSHRIRRVDFRANRIETIAGNGVLSEEWTWLYGWARPRGTRSPDGLPATESGLDMPTRIGVDARDNIYVIDSSNYRIVRIDGSTRVLTTVTSGLHFINAMAVSPSGDVYYTTQGGEPDFWVYKVPGGVGAPERVAGTGRAATLQELEQRTATTPLNEAFISQVSDMVFVEPSKLYIWTTGLSELDFDAGVVNVVPTRGPSSLINGLWSAQIHRLPDGDFLILDPNKNHLMRLTPEDGQLITIAGDSYSRRPFSHPRHEGWGRHHGDGGDARLASFSLPSGLAVDGEGNIYIADTRNCVIRKIIGPAVELPALDRLLPE